MVAITVILAAVIGTFVLGLGDQVQQTSPNAQWNVDYDESSTGEWRITHEGGDSVEAARLELSVSGSSNNDGTYDWSNYNSGASPIGAGDSAEFNSTSGTYASGEFDGATVRLIWTAEGGGTSSTLTTWEGPSA